jgi:hypothetical protein
MVYFQTDPNGEMLGISLTGSFGKVNMDKRDRKITRRKLSGKKHRKSQDFALNKDTSLAKICVRKNTFSKYLTWLWNFYTSE